MVLLCLERCVDCVPEPLSWRLFAYSSRSVPIWLYLDTTKKWQWLQGSVAASHSVSRPGPPPGRFSQPFLSAGKNARGVGRAWGLRGRQPLSAVRSRTGEGGGRVQSHPAPKPGGRAQSGGGESRGLGGWCVCVWAAGQNYVAASPRYLLFYITTARVSNILKCDECNHSDLCASRSPATPRKPLR